MNVYVISRPFTARDSRADANRGGYVCMLLFRLLVSYAHKLSYDCNMYKTTPYVCHLSAQDTRMDEKDRIRTVQNTFLISRCKTLLQRPTSRLLDPFMFISGDPIYSKYWLRVVCRCILWSRCYTKVKNILAPKIVGWGCGGEICHRTCQNHEYPTILAPSEYIAS